MSDFTLGQHAAQIAELDRKVERALGDLDEIKQYMSARQSERRFAVWVAGAIGGIASFLASHAGSIIALLVGRHTA